MVSQQRSPFLPQVLPSKALSSLLSLTSLDLSDSIHLKTIESGALVDLKTLDTLILDGSPALRNFGRASLHRPSNIRKALKVNLRHMSWKRVPKSLIENSLEGNGNSELQLEGNPFICDCRAIELQAFLVKVSNGSSSSRAECSTPASLNGRELVQIDKDDLICLNEEDLQGKNPDESNVQVNQIEQEETSVFDEGPPLSSSQKVGNSGSLKNGTVRTYLTDLTTV